MLRLKDDVFHSPPSPWKFEGKAKQPKGRNQERKLDSLLFPFIAFLLLLQFYNSPSLSAEREEEQAGQENSYLIDADAGCSWLLLDLADV